MLGTVKAYTIDLARSEGWEESDFRLSKGDLRNRYELRRPPTEEINLSKPELLVFLKAHAF